jgi:hypothetical protein
VQRYALGHELFADDESDSFKWQLKTGLIRVGSALDMKFLAPLLLILSSCPPRRYAKRSQFNSSKTFNGPDRTITWNRGSRMQTMIFDSAPEIDTSDALSGALLGI